MPTTLQHHRHEHALTRMQLSGWVRSRCSICLEKIHDGTAYACRKCTFFLHEPCALVELPLIADHPRHPGHPLVFRGDRYWCDICDFHFHPGNVIVPPPLEGTEDTMQHAGHDHTLYAFHVKVPPNWIECDGCGEGIPGSAYGCFKCSFFLHESCARLPEGMLQHPFHREHMLELSRKKRGYCLYCKACHNYSEYELLYSCEECNFELDIKCAALLLSLQDQEKEARVGIDHLSHKHQLLSGHVEERKHTLLRCAVCELKISGEIYYCPGCIFFLHKQCADELVQDMAHYLHTEHRLILHQEAPYESGSFRCNCCGMKCSGMVFHCASCDFNLDPRCALQTFSASRDGAAAKIQHFSHEDPLILRYVEEASKSEDSCKACYRQVPGLTYRCEECDYFLHKSCAELPLQLEHPLHPSHPLILLPDKPHHCDNCSSRLGGFGFYCTDCVFYLCLRCATETPTLKHQLHEHTLSYFRDNPAKDSVCNYCGEDCSFDLYRCIPCNFNLHWACHTLPATIEHECHPYHPLVLFDRFVEGLPEYQWCDYCEEIRHPDRGVYRCAREECWYTAHIGCVLPLVRRNENPPYPDKLKKEIESLKETIEEREKDLDALKERLSRLEIEAERKLIKT